MFFFVRYGIRFMCSCSYRVMIVNQSTSCHSNVRWRCLRHSIELLYILERLGLGRPNADTALLKNTIDTMHCVFLGSLTTKEGTRIQRPRSHFRPLSTVSTIKCF